MQRDDNNEGDEHDVHENGIHKFDEGDHGESNNNDGDTNMHVNKKTVTENNY